ncbi:ABC transporter ATP-binding protein, partial [Tractidigestivibacter sp.]|uniref:ABC transporter ATP-binding protein n=1 Tax=Tractidigestivibacter sp. TaxID=2847320 RepID=UPI003FD8F9FE
MTSTDRNRMLELRDISKKYVTGNFTQGALDNISVAFRDSEFVAVLGPSGSGKTTMLNVVGGLDHFDSGDLLVDGISTKRFRDRDWDAYRNNRIGFVFQSYNLIPHQTILANVELALTLSGVSRAERRKRALKALADVGLADHVDKRPAQLSGGQMQRVAIARALINDPEILLADEPTGALDSVTSVQVMDLLKEVSRDRLVVMVTHNPELARQYATRIVELRDGHITSDSDPFEPGLEEERRPAKPTRKTSMSFLTAMGLSFNNLMTKKGRTIMTAFAGSIGIIGIAAILSLANGVNNYINNVEEETLSAYPVQISEQSVDMSSMLSAASAEGDGLSSRDNADLSEDGTVATTPMVSNMAQSVGSNDTASLKTYLDENGGGIRD